jgi:hypothetical protein
MALPATPAGQSPFVIDDEMANFHRVAILAQQHMAVHDSATPNASANRDVHKVVDPSARAEPPFTQDAGGTIVHQVCGHP